LSTALHIRRNYADASPHVHTRTRYSFQHSFFSYARRCTQTRNQAVLSVMYRPLKPLQQTLQFSSEIKSLFVTVFKVIPLRSTYKPHQDNNTIRLENIIFSLSDLSLNVICFAPSIWNVRNSRKSFLDARLIEESINVDLHGVARRSEWGYN
jgi:hypothetical protein